MGAGTAVESSRRLPEAGAGPEGAAVAFALGAGAGAEDGPGEASSTCVGVRHESLCISRSATQSPQLVFHVYILVNMSSPALQTPSPGMATVFGRNAPNEVQVVTGPASVGNVLLRKS